MTPEVHRTRRRWWMLAAGLLALGLAAALAVYASSEGDHSGASPRIPQPTAAQLDAAGLDRLPLAPQSRRVDLATPRFSHPTKITNPLYPIGYLRSAVFSGRVAGKPFHTETTLLPGTRTVGWPRGQQVETLVSQYVAYLDGRIEEVALDHYAQADDGSVWYFGEDVFDYDHGVIADREGTWLAGEDGPAAMIMPAHPRVGDVYRTENVPGVVFEEIKVKAVDRTVDGPHGRVAGAMIGEELHPDGPPEDKTFAPGYGEFFTGGGGEVEAMALAVPADGLSGRPPSELETLVAGANRVFDQVGSRHWKAASATVGRTTVAWKALRSGRLPPRLVPDTSRALGGLGRGVAAHDPAKARNAAIAVAQRGLDLELRNRPAAEIDRARFVLWARQLAVDAAGGDTAGVRGDLATLGWIRDRFAHTLDKVRLTRLDAHLLELQTKVSDNDLRGASAQATLAAGSLNG